MQKKKKPRRWCQSTPTSFFSRSYLSTSFTVDFLLLLFATLKQRTEFLFIFPKAPAESLVSVQRELASFCGPTVKKKKNGLSAKKSAH